MIIYIITPLLMFILGCQPIFAETISSDEFIYSYDPDNKYEINSRLKDATVSRYMPVDGEVLDQDSDLDRDSMYKDFYPENKLPQIYSFITNSILSWYTHQRAWISRNPVQSYIIRLFQWIETVQIPFLTRLDSLMGKEVRNPVTSKKTSQVSQQVTQSRTVNGIKVPPSLVRPKLSRQYSTFASPYSQTTPEQVKEVYTWDQLWNPHYNPHYYLQCTAYVAMVYNMNGISLKGKVYGDARNWIYLTEVFNVYASGEDSTPPSKMDVAVWADKDMNHVGVIVEVTETMIRIINANAEKQMYTFMWSQDENGIVTITNSAGDTSQHGWVPSHWLRYKK